MISQCVSSLHGHSSRQGPEHTHDHHSPASQVSVWGTLESFAEVVSLPSASLLSHAPSLPLSTKLALTSAGLCPSAPGSWQGCGEAGDSSAPREEETGNKVLLAGGCFPQV